MEKNKGHMTIRTGHNRTEIDNGGWVFDEWTNGQIRDIMRTKGELKDIIPLAPDTTGLRLTAEVGAMIMELEVGLSSGLRIIGTPNEI